MSLQASIPQVTISAQPSWPALQRELEAFLNTQRRSFLREDARMALWAQTPRDAWRRLDDIATARVTTPVWFYDLQARIKPLLEVQG